MESWNTLLNVALLGTEKRGLEAAELDVVFEESVGLIQAQTTDREEVFLQTAALVFNYRQCGFLPLHKQTVSMAPAEEEEKPYASPEAHTVLTEILETGSAALLRFWLEQCRNAGTIVQPEILPALLHTHTKTRTLMSLIDACGGRRGEWLRQFNQDWKKDEVLTEEERWQTGTLTQRKELLAGVRKTDPVKGRELLQQTWQQETAATKAELLEPFEINAGEEDLPWLEEVLKEKSTKVKEAAINMLKAIPSSEIIQRYWNIARQSVQLVSSKGLLGIGSKTTLEIKLVGLDESIYKTGIQPLSSEANVPEEQFVLYQLMSFVPPHFWEGHFKLGKKEILELFFKSGVGRPYFSAFGLAATQFKNLEWLTLIIDMDEERPYSDAFEILPQKEAEQYALRFLDVDLNAAGVLQSLGHFKEEWSVEFAKGVLCYTAKNGYQFQRSFYSELAAVLPVAVAGVLESCTPREAHLQTTWRNMSEYISKLMTLKQQTLNAFPHS